MTYDVTTFNGEYDLWDIRYNSLKGFVDEFIVVGFDKTFSGKEKELYPPNKHYEKVRWVTHDESVYGKYRELAESSPNTLGASHWKTEFMMKESLKDAIAHLEDTDIVFIGDVDEIWDEAAIDMVGTWKLKLVVYTYWLNNRSNEEFWGPVRAKYGAIKDLCFNHLRTEAPKTVGHYGVHFTSMGGHEALKKKLTDSYTKESYATDYVLENLQENYGHKDFLGRNFAYWEDEGAWPRYLRKNKESYQHLCR